MKTWVSKEVGFKSSLGGWGGESFVTGPIG